jgi:hypothetical protein
MMPSLTNTSSEVSCSLVCPDEDDVEFKGAGPFPKSKLAAKDLQHGRLPATGVMGYATVATLWHGLEFG